MTNILLISTNCSWNKGSAAQVISTTETLRNLVPEATFTLVSRSPELDSKLCKIHGIEVASLSRALFHRNPFQRNVIFLRLLVYIYYLLCSALWFALNRIKINANVLLNNGILKEYSEADIVIDLSGDTLADKNAFPLMSILGIFIGKFLGKKIAVFSQSIGPFKRATRSLARFCLNVVDLIVIRDDITKKYLLDLGVNNPSTYLAAEIAFLLEPAPLPRVQEIFKKEDIDTNKKNGPLIGIGTSALISAGFKKGKNPYVELMAKISDYLVERMNAQIVYIPHVIVPPNYGSPDDRYAGVKTHQIAQNKTRIKIVKGDYSPEELKGIIGQCDLFIGARMHSNIAGTSMHVPTIALSWSHKYSGIMRMLEQEDYVCEIGTTTFDELVTKINTAWSNRVEIRQKLASKTKEMQESAFHSCMLLVMLIKSNSVQN